MWTSDRERNYLFHKHGMYAVIEHQKTMVAKTADALPEKRVKEEDMGRLASEIAAKLVLDVPVLDEENITVSKATEVQVEVRDSFGFPDGGRHFAKGTSVTFTVPFTGDREMFFVAPNSSDANQPMADVETDALQFTITGVQLEAAQIKSQFTRFLESVKKYLGWQKDNVATFNKELEQLAVRALAERKRRLLEADDLVGSLGYKVR
jgi:hypothetical protein